MRLAAERRSRIHWIDTLLLLAALGVGGAAAIALAARAFWVAELFTHFRLQYAAVQAPLLLALVLRKHRLAAALTAPLLAVNLLVLAAYWPRPAPPATERSGFTLMTANLNLGNDASERFVAVVRETRPDAIVLLEVTPAWSDALSALATDYPIRHLAPREDPFGIGILSRIPLTSVATLDLRGAPAIDARLALGTGRDLRLLGAHLRPPVSAHLARERNAQLHALGALVGDVTEPLVVTGDFNATPYSPVLSDWLAQTGLHDPRRGRGFAITWPAFLPILGIPIDHSFVSEHVMASEPRRSAPFGSDHFAILTRLSLRE